MSESTQRLLETEAAVSSLLEELKRLHAVTGGFSSARNDLDSVRQDLLRLVEEVRQCTASAMESCGSIKSLSMPELLDRVAAIRAGVEAAQAEAERSLQRTSNEVVDKLAQATTQITAQQAGSLQSLSQETAAGFERLGKEIGEAVGRGHQESATLLRSIDAQIRETLSSMVDRTVKETAMRLDAARNTQAALLRETEASLTTIVSPQGERIERLEQTVTDLSQALEAAEAAAKSNHADVTDRVTQLKIEQSAALNRMKGQLVSLATLTILGLIVGFVALGAFLSQMFQSSTQPFR